MALLNEADSSLEIDIARDPVARMKLTAAVSHRRAHLVKFVTAAVGLAALLCAAAVVKAAVAHSDKASPSPVWVVQPEATAAPVAPEPGRDTATLGQMAGESPTTGAPSTASVPLDPKAAAKAAKEAAKEKAKWRWKTNTDRASH